MAITERQNADRVFGRAEGKPEWVPVVGVYNELKFSSGLHERPDGPVGDDWAGCHWEFDEQSIGYAPDLHQPLVLQDICDWRDVVKFPDLDAVDWEACAKKDLEGFDRENKYLCMFMETGPWERVHALMGMEEACIALYDEPEELKGLLEAITNYKVAAIRKLGEYYKPDQFFFQDDLGTANGPQMSLECYREFLKPCHARIAEAIHEQGAFYIHHSCGWMDAFVEDLVEIGVDSINPLQSMNDWEGLVERFGDKVRFDVGIGLTDDPRNTADDVRAEARRIIDTFGPTRNLTMVGFGSNRDTLYLVDAGVDEAIKYGREAYAA